MNAQVSDPLIGLLHPFPTKSFESAKMFAGIPQFFATPRGGQCSRTNLSLFFVIALVWQFLCHVLHVPGVVSTKFSLLPIDRLLCLLDEGRLDAGV